MALRMSAGAYGAIRPDRRDASLAGAMIRSIWICVSRQNIARFCLRTHIQMGRARITERHFMGNGFRAISRLEFYLRFLRKYALDWGGMIVNRPRHLDVPLARQGMTRRACSSWASKIFRSTRASWKPDGWIQANRVGRAVKGGIVRRSP